MCVVCIRLQVNTLESVTHQIQLVIVSRDLYTVNIDVVCDVVCIFMLSVVYCTCIIIV